MKKILVIDDSKTIRTICEWIYKGLDDKIITAETASSGRSLLSREQPDLLFVDYSLPDADLYEFIGSLQGFGIPIVVLAGRHAPFDADRARARGAVEVLMKPFKSGDFYKCVERALLASTKLAQEAAVQMPNLERATPPNQAQLLSSNASKVGAPPTPKRFNFPNSGSSDSNSQASGLRSAPHPQSLTPAHSNHSGMSNVSSYHKPADLATPKTPVPSISPAVTGQGQVQIDQALLRAEVVAAVKSLLPGIVNNYLKKLIQAEVKPQLQNWVDARVEALFKKFHS